MNAKAINMCSAKNTNVFAIFQDRNFNIMFAKDFLLSFEQLGPGYCFFIGIKHGFSCINIRQAEGRGFQHLPRDLADVNALKNHVRSLLLHKN